MSKKLPSGITRNILEAVPLPNHGGRYTPIAHKTIMDEVDKAMTNNNLTAVKHEYSSTIHGNVAVGKVLIDTNDDELQLAFFWGNSYDKSSRFTCSVGAYIKRADSFLLLSNIAKYARKHTGNADQLAINMISDQFNNSSNYADELNAVKDLFKNTKITSRQMAEIAGVLFIEKGVLNKEQMSSLRSLLDKKINITDSYNSMWNFYCLTSSCIRSGHPKSWFDCQMNLTSYLKEVAEQGAAEINAPTDEKEKDFVDINQITIFDVIETNSNSKEETLEELPWSTDNDSPLELPEL